MKRVHNQNTCRNSALKPLNGSFIAFFLHHYSSISLQRQACYINSTEVLPRIFVDLDLQQQQQQQPCARNYFKWRKKGRILSINKEDHYHQSYLAFLLFRLKICLKYYRSIWNNHVDIVLCFCLLYLLSFLQWDITLLLTNTNSSV